ncbi:PLP-dependent aminotransferase family protein [Pseudooceanicola sp. CBS1P-1]|uniref:Aminotransferase class I/II-fold pyridoxal phosphate-dependent enzyme n=1 Tax=Pseudooceanicola albus TaxID=2692189 RepID=A0A6L7FYW6_9RHOB|nr:MULTISPECIES: PLP-dependent aminotransferase family protein [Pseudooceanicola]MBT9383360.1 PLP-dependent aminotransferase family protein [Pseudooceanicola endophyticus]MXN16317.1 aminotransferase class I/II-fold pyridoxal phosphate-dependent enzyme [Pseudooceanicola albus]
MQDWTPQELDSGTPRYIAIADAIARDIRAGRLTSGVRLPPQRKLAARLGIDFTTVSRAYGEAQARGHVESHVGRGTFVKGSVVSTAPDPARAGEGDLSMNMPPEPTDPQLLAQMQEGLGYVSANLVGLLRYQSPIGTERDRMAASSWLSMRGMVPALDRVAVTPGAHATMAAILSIITRPGDVMLCEAITYPGIRNIAARFGVTLVGLEMDADGILPGALLRAIADQGPKALYLNPTLQNPTTLTMPEARRLEVAEILRRHDLTLIEDDAYGFIPARAPAPIALSAPEQTWHIGGLAKCIGAGLRLAYTIAPTPRCAHHLAQALRALTVMPSPLAMALTTQWIEDGTADNIRRFIRAESAARQGIAAEVLGGHAFRAAENAFNLWLTLPPGVTRADVLARMARQPIGVVPSDAFTVAGAPPEALRIGLGGAVSRARLREGLQQLVHATIPDTYMG